MSTSKRTVCWFSCGAASAVATKIAIDEFGDGPLVVACTHINQEHPDNVRFIADCERWFNRKIVVLKNEQYQGDIYEVFRRTRYLVGPTGAACTRLLKKEVRTSFELPTDRQVFGFTSEEQDRYDRFLDANNIECDAPLIRHGLSKADCLGVIAKAGIEIPAMYRLGYHNNNCIGCVKGGAGYWNKIRIDFPEVFERMSKTERELGRTVTKWVHADGKRRRGFLSDLPPNAGNYASEVSIECGVVCQMAAFDYGDDCDEL